MCVVHKRCHEMIITRCPGVPVNISNKQTMKKNTIKPITKKDLLVRFCKTETNSLIAGRKTRGKLRFQDQRSTQVRNSFSFTKKHIFYLLSLPGSKSTTTWSSLGATTVAPSSTAWQSRAFNAKVLPPSLFKATFDCFKKSKLLNFNEKVLPPSPFKATLDCFRKF